MKNKLFNVWLRKSEVAEESAMKWNIRIGNSNRFWSNGVLSRPSLCWLILAKHERGIFDKSIGKKSGPTFLPRLLLQLQTNVQTFHWVKKKGKKQRSLFTPFNRYEYQELVLSSHDFVIVEKTRSFFHRCMQTFDLSVCAQAQPPQPKVQTLFGGSQVEGRKKKVELAGPSDIEAPSLLAHC